MLLLNVSFLSNYCRTRFPFEFFNKILIVICEIYLMKVFAIIGYTNSGKTSTLIEIVKELVKRGCRVNTIKAIHIDNFSIETEGKDSWLHKQAGASVTATRSNVETSIMYQKSMSAKELIPYFECDYLVMEGFTDEKKIPKVLCAKDKLEIDHRFDDTVFALSGIISNTITNYKGIKVINGLKEIEELVDLIIHNAIESSNVI